MIKKLLFTLLITSSIANAQSYAPPAGQPNTTAIPKNSSIFIGWATGATITRGPQNIANPAGPLANVGDSNSPLGGSSSSVVSLGDGGSAIVTFDFPIANGPGFDFAVFENGFSDTFLELAFVEVSSDGINFFRFPSHSETQTTTQVGSFGAIDCRYINNLAGKYRANFGTPFDLSDIPNNVLLNKDNITHVKIIDVVGSIDPLYATYDSYGNIVNDPYPTSFDSGGFDLNAVGIINKKTLNNPNFETNLITIYPNPTSDILYLTSDEESKIIIYDITGNAVKKLPKGNHKEIIVSDLNSGIYLFEITILEKKTTKRIIIK